MQKFNFVHYLNSLTERDRFTKNHVTELHIGVYFVIFVQ